jgi:hypothetical protein
MADADPDDDVADALLAEVFWAPARVYRKIGLRMIADAREALKRAEVAPRPFTGDSER